jgi:hypothetical protein
MSCERSCCIIKFPQFKWRGHSARKENIAPSRQKKNGTTSAHPTPPQNGPAVAQEVIQDTSGPLVVLTLYAAGDGAMSYDDGPPAIALPQHYQ